MNILLLIRFEKGPKFMCDCSITTATYSSEGPKSKILKEFSLRVESSLFRCSLFESEFVLLLLAQCVSLKINLLNNTDEQDNVNRICGCHYMQPKICICASLSGLYKYRILNIPPPLEDCTK